MHSKYLPSLLIAFVFAFRGLSSAPPIGAVEPTTDDIAKADAFRALELGKAEMSQWKFFVDKDRSRELKLVTSPILRWSNPTVGRVYGNLYVLTDDECPRAIVCPYKFFTPNTRLDMECVSLAPTDISGIRNEKKIWSTSKKGVDWKPVPGNPPVGKSNTERQRQLKQLAAEFTAELIDTRVNENGEQQQLRLLTQPVYRYESKSQHVLNGGIFSFVIGTDPELLLLLESIETRESSSWRYGLVRMNIDGLLAKYHDQEVWRVGKLPWPVYLDPEQPYFVYADAEK